MNGSLDDGLVNDATPFDSFGVGGFKLGTPPAGHSFTGYAVALQSDYASRVGFGDIIVAGYDQPPPLPDSNPSYPLLMRFNP